MIVYKHTHRGSGKSYVGFTSLTMTERWMQHVNNARSYPTCKTRKFWNALRKYGTEDWAHDCLAICHTLSDAKRLEVHYIQLFDTYRSGHNTTLGGEGRLGHTHSDETKRKLSRAGKGRLRTAAFKENVSRVVTDAHKTRIYRRYRVYDPAGTVYETTNLKRFCVEHCLKLEVLRWTLTTGRPCPYVNKGWKVEHV